MSYQATAWAVKVRTGSTGLKALLLVLAHHADEKGGRCFPSQATLARECEQSLDTVQRNLRKLEMTCVITRRVRPRSGGHWPRHEYQLTMPGPLKITFR
jgi:pyocin large subunit-like protein